MSITTEEPLVLPFIPNEWLDFLYNQQHIIDDFDVVPFGGAAISDAGVSDDTTSFGDDPIHFLGADSDFIVDDVFSPFSPPGSDKGNGAADDPVFVHDVTGPTGTTTKSSDDDNNNNNDNTSSAATAAAAAASAASNVDLSPKSTIAKQVKRRSRASRRTPTTLLNASIKNFRTLVQQYTGCQSSASGSFRSGKGPITLNFAAPSERNNDFPAWLSSSFGGNYYNYSDHPAVSHHQVDQI